MNSNITSRPPPPPGGRFTWLTVILSFAKTALVALGLAGLGTAACEDKPDAQQVSPTPVTANPPTPASTPAFTIPRVVAFSPAVGIILSDLGYASTVVGRHGFDSFLSSTLPVCGDQDGVDYEALLAVSPTLIITQWGSRELPARLATLSKQHNWLVHDERLLTLADIRGAVARLDLLARGQPIEPSGADGTNDPVARLSASGRALWQQMDRAWSNRGGTSPRRVLLLASLSPPAAFGPGSCHHEILLAVAGPEAGAIQGGAAYITLDQEDLLNLRADVYIIIQPGPGESAPKKSDVASVNAASYVVSPGPLSPLPAGPAFSKMTVANTRIITDPKAFIPSTAMISFADQLWLCLEQTKGNP